MQTLDKEGSVMADNHTAHRPPEQGRASKGAANGQIPKSFDEKALAAFLGILLDPSMGCAEIRVLGASIEPRTLQIVPHDVYQSTIAVWGDDVGHLVRQASRIEGCSAYITVNPANPALKARANRLVKAKATTKDEDIVCLRFLYLDFDPERPDGISSTDEERAVARARLEKVLADHPDLVASSIWGSSGNGYWLLVLLPDYPNDVDHRALSSHVIDWFFRHYSDELVKIDQKTKNPSRVMPLVGTGKHKGISLGDRQHRPATIESPPGRELVPFDLEAWAAIHAPAEKPGSQARDGQAHNSSSTRTTGNATDVEERAIAYLAKIDPAISGQKGHNRTFYAACKVGPGFDLAQQTAFRLIWDHYNPRCQPPWTEKQIRHKIEDAYKKETRRGWLLNAGRGRSGNRRRGPAGQVSTPVDAGQPTDTRPAIEVNTERHTVVEETVKALARDPDLFRRGAVLGVVIEEGTDVADLGGGIELVHARGNPRFLPLSDATLGCHLTLNASFYAWRKDRSGEFVASPAHPPDWLIKAVATHGHYPGIRRLVSIASCPYVRPDGSVSTPGYDRSTRTLYLPSIELPPLPDHPTQDDAKKAASQLNDRVIQFPFTTGFDWSVWLTGLLTAIQRPAIRGPVPGFAFNGNKPGCGKGLLIDLIGLIVWGHSIATRSYPMDPIEAGKVKLSLALAGVPVVHFDNLREGGLYGNSELDSALTTIEAEGRILGTSRESGPVPLRPCWFLSGNNISPSKDAYRRWLPCNLETALENPHERDDYDVKDLRNHVREHRADLLHDALVILKAHALTGRPPAVNDKGQPVAPLGSFEEWDTMVRGAVHFVTGNDCLTTQRKAAAEAPDRQDKLALLEGWAQLPDGGARGSGLTIEEAIRLAADSPATYPMLHSALMRFSKDGKMPNHQRIGYTIRGMVRANIGGFRFERNGENRDHATLWRVVNA
jgi:hypothetical protein